MNILKCPNCNATISIEDNREYGFCPYCGTKIQLVQTVKMIHEGTVNVSGIQSNEQVLATAKRMISSGEKQIALDLLRNLTHTAPDCGEAWLGEAYLDYYLNTFSSSVNYHNACQKAVSNYFIKHIPLSLIKQETVTDFLNTSSMSKSQNIMGETITPFLKKIVTSLENNIEETILKMEKTTKKIINDMQYDISLLNGYSYKDPDGWEISFFSHNNTIYLLKTNKE